jgi:hypothetical protein
MQELQDENIHRKIKKKKMIGIRYWLRTQKYCILEQSTVLRRKQI